MIEDTTVELLRHFKECVRSMRSSAGYIARGHANRRNTTCMWRSEDVSERQGVKCRCCLAASHCQLSDLADCGQLNPTELLTRSNLNLAILNRMTIQKAIQKAVTIRGHCGQCRELYLATACPSACSQSYHQTWCIFRFDLSVVYAHCGVKSICRALINSSA